MMYIDDTQTYKINLFNNGFYFGQLTAWLSPIIYDQLTGDKTFADAQL